ncbi:hypothetical protein EIP91_006594 [Steccherinum ochraceum]|uniref:Glycoside hydrolase 131 catalytic N-terminal domain-containing protein n=1 Tax=Steccherinum ochraceum TaxID=92696 RepID=A0A4R0R5F5_9APHY|nr:hypothetical protein EIP91_006594 [Steccherinum ochraceum]
MLWTSLLGLLTLAAASPLIWDGRAPFTLDGDDLNNSTGPYLTVVKGATEDATHYTTLHGHSLAPTPLWNKFSVFPSEQVVSVSIDNSSVFIPGGSTPQNGFRRTDIIAANDGDHADLIPLMEQGTTVFHFSIKKDDKRPLNYNHEYQIVFIEPNDGTHVFGIQLGSPFTNPTGPLPVKNAHSFKVLDHALNVLFMAPFTSEDWHNFAIQVDWNARTLAVFYSTEGQLLKPVTKVLPNLSATAGADGQGDFHFGVLKLPLVNPADTPANQGDVVHFGIQEGTTEALFYSGVFVENVTKGVSIGNGRTHAVIA